MKSLFLFSGFEADEGFPEQIAHRLCEEITDRQLFVLIASSPSGHEKTDLYLNERYLKWLANAGIIFVEAEVIDDRKTKSECIELIGKASAIFLAGGATLHQIAFIKENELVVPLQRCNAVILGMSAGAINMAKFAFCTLNERNGQTHIYRGIDLVDISIKPHFSFNDEFITNEILPFSSLIDIYCMCDNSAIIVRGNECEMLGDIYLASSNRIEKIKYH